MRKTFLGVVAIVTLAACGGRNGGFEEAVGGRRWSVLVANRGTNGAPTILAAHAFLGLNRPNDALCTLASASAADLAVWDSWTMRFVGTHDSSVAHYLRGDALARRADWARALGELDRSLVLDPMNVLALNARGVVRSFASDWDGAATDLIRAMDLDPGFADAFASRGFSILHSKSEPGAALEAFQAALRIAPDFGAATMGAGFAQLALARWEEGNRHLERASTQTPCGRAVLSGSVAQIAAWVENRAGMLEDAAGEAPGTVVNRDLKRLTDGDVSALKPLARAVGNDPSLANKVNKTIEALKLQKPELHSRIQEEIGKGEAWTAPRGGAETLLKGLKGVSVDAGVKIPARDSLINRQLEKTASDHDGWSSMQKSQPPGGVIVSAQVDLGDWPLKPLYTLLYAVAGASR